MANNENAVQKFSRMAASTEKDRYSSSVLRTFPFGLLKNKLEALEVIKLVDHKGENKG